MNYWIWYANLKMIGNKEKRKILEYYKTPENIYNTSKEELIKTIGIDEDICNYIVSNKDKNTLENMEKYMKKYNIKNVNMYDNEYPENLKKIYDPPITLFYKGNLELLNDKCIAVIGSRNATNYGKKTSYKIAKELSENGYIVVSGLARGIDTYAHKGAIASNKKTIAVIASGHDYIYPIDNYELYDEIAKEGLILSEYIVGTPPATYNFPARNRIVSGISNAIIVVEAMEKSGALITVDFAIDEGKEVYAVPGNIDSKQSVGVNGLIKNGANVYTSIEDLSM